MKQKLEVISKAVAEKLEAHAQCHSHVYRGAAPWRRGAIWLRVSGRARVAASESHRAQRESPFPMPGSKIGSSPIFPRSRCERPKTGCCLPSRSSPVRRWMPAASPMLLGAVEISGSAHDSIFKLVPEVMDGKGMMRFMRDSRLLRVARRGRKPSCKAVSPRDEKAARARRSWERVRHRPRAGRKSFATHRKG